MLDPVLRRWIDPPLDRAGAWLAARGVSANHLSLAGLAIGLSAVPLLAFGQLRAGACGHPGQSPAGRPRWRRSPGTAGQRPWAAISTSSATWSSTRRCRLGFALARPENALWAALLLASFVCTCASFLGRAVLAAAAGRADTGRGGANPSSMPRASWRGRRRSSRLILFCLLPGTFPPWLAGVVAVLCASGRRSARGWPRPSLAESEIPDSPLLVPGFAVTRLARRVVLRKFSNRIILLEMMITNWV